MSYDIRLGVRVLGTDIMAEIGRPEYDSPTYNLREMFHACTGWNYKQGTWYPCELVYDNICNGISELLNDPWKYKEYEPENGWGTINTALEALQSMRDYIDEREKEIPLEYLFIRW